MDDNEMLCVTKGQILMKGIPPLVGSNPAACDHKLLSHAGTSIIIRHSV